MKQIHENRLIRMLIANDCPRAHATYYNDKRKNSRRRIFKTFGASVEDCQNIIKRLEYFGLTGWQVWDKSWNPYQTGIFKREPLN